MGDTTEKAILAGGCFWGMQDLIRKRPGCGLDAGRLHRRRRRQCDLPQPRHARRGDRDRLRPGADLLPRPARVLLPDPRPDDGEPSGQRHRHELPLGDLLPRRRAAARRRGHDRRRRGLGPVARQGRHRGRARRAVLGGRARAPGLPRALPATGTPATSRGRDGCCPAGPTPSPVRAEAPTRPGGRSPASATGSRRRAARRRASTPAAGRWVPDGPRGRPRAVR